MIYYLSCNLLWCSTIAVFLDWDGSEQSSLCCAATSPMPCLLVQRKMQNCLFVSCLSVGDSSDRCVDHVVRDDRNDKCKRSLNACSHITHHLLRSCHKPEMSHKSCIRSESWHGISAWVWELENIRIQGLSDPRDFRSHNCIDVLCHRKLNLRRLPINNRWRHSK